LFLGGGLIPAKRLIATLLVLLPCTVAVAASVPHNEFAARIVAAHNAERAAAGMPPLSWDAQLASGAAAYAQQLAASGTFAHSDRSKRPGIGENLWMGSHGYFSYEAMVGGWTAEKRFFVPGVFPNNSRTGNWADVGHYTQMIWPTTQRVGCAVATAKSTDYLVCRYASAGNIDGRRLP
jgi:hypothetical protein